MKIALVTGGGSGIGKALALQLSHKLEQVYIVGRNMPKLNATKELNPDKISLINADVRLNADRLKIKRILAKIQLDYLIHNAGIMNNVGNFATITLTNWRDMQKTNVEAPMFLTQALMPNLKRGSRVLHISSGAGHNPYEGMLCYGISKAALFYLYRGLNLELQKDGILFGSFMPGVVDTDILLSLRSQDVGVFPRVSVYQDLYTNGKLRSPNMVAKILENFLCNTNDEIFVSKDWRIEEFEKLNCE